MAPVGRFHNPGGFPNSGGFPHFSFHNRHFHHFHHYNRVAFFNQCFTFPCFDNFGLFGGFGFGATYLPYYPLFPEDYSSYYQQPAPQPAVATSTGYEAQLTAEVQRLSDEIQDLREDQERRAQAPPPPPPGTSLSAVPPVPAVFVFRDGRRISAQNYAITGQTLWILNEHTAKRYPVADLDRAATDQANAGAGIDLRLPSPAH
ncbi:MAG TPA: hypothetical protein VLT16_05855 [Candidatus Limnocylindrales bacterium]|nr:hypothetical protein [Candidatus Limnocylindrales bacterium]